MNLKARATKLILTGACAVLQLFLYAQERELFLHEGWVFRSADSDRWFKAEVPGNIHRDLLINKLIPDPFAGDNEKKVQWVEKKDWIYELYFNIPDSIFNRTHIELTFEGLDTYADVYLNEKRVLNASNMFRTWQAHVKPFVQKEKNLLRVYFHSPVNYAMNKCLSNSFSYPADNDENSCKTSPYTRKSPVHYGWDFAPRLVTSGIWKNVHLTGWSESRIKDATASLLSLEQDKALIMLQGVFSSDTTYRGRAVILINHQPSDSFDLLLEKDKDVLLKFPLQINKPVLWWPRGYGNPYMYEITLELKTPHGTRVKTFLYGIRKIQLVQEAEDRGSESFYFRVNDVPVFAKGANYIPLSRIYGEPDYQNLFKKIIGANMNMLRVWGGGIYENGEFYDLADKNGILIWQDLMFANTMYPWTGDTSFQANVRAELAEVESRLGRHSCLALWCGNNEIEVAWKNWGWQQKYHYTGSDIEKMESDYEKLFYYETATLGDHENSNYFIPYIPSSPVSNWGNQTDFKKGDNHYWGVWHGELAFESFRDHVPRFMSEYGFPSFPSFQSIQALNHTTNFNLQDPAIRAHQKSYKGNGLILKYHNWYYSKPAHDSDYTWTTQLLQADAYQVAATAHRLAKPYCMGTLLWQLNDCWPGITWSVIDDKGICKPAYYRIRETYQSFLVHGALQDTIFSISIVSDSSLDVNTKLTYELTDFSGRIWDQKEIALTIPRNSSGIYASFPAANLKNITTRKNFFVKLSLNSGRKTLAQELVFLDTTKNLNLNKTDVDVSVSKYTGFFGFLKKREKDTYVITLKTDQLVKGLFLYHKDIMDFSDNGFDLLPGIKKRISVETPSGKKEIAEKLVVKSLNDLVVR